MAINNGNDPTGPQMGKAILDALSKKVADEIEKQILDEIEPIIAAAKARVRETAVAAAREMEPTIQSFLDRDASTGAYGSVFKVLIQVKAPGEKWDASEAAARCDPSRP